MSSPVLQTNNDHVDQDFPFYHLDNSLWSLLNDHCHSILAVGGYDNDISLDHIFHYQENSLSAKLIESTHEHYPNLSVPLQASVNPPSPLLHENRILLPVEEDYDQTSRELNSCVFLDQHENSALTGPITDKEILENSTNDHEDHNILPTTTEGSENLCQILGVNHDASDKKLHGNSSNHHNYDSNLSNSTLEGTSNESWPLLEKGSTSLDVENHENSVGFDSTRPTGKAASPAQATPSIDKGLLGKKFNAETKERHHKLKRLRSEKQPSKEEGQISKKQEHNAKEKIRRMKLNAIYLALGELLPSHRKTKKRRSAPVIIDRALEYIPELEKEIKDLTLRKNNLTSTIENQNLRETPQLSNKLQASTVSLHEVVKGEVIIQIVCIQKDQETTVFSNLLQNVEAEGMSILSASTLQVCKEWVCYQLLIQMLIFTLSRRKAMEYHQICLQEWNFNSYLD